MMKKYLLLALLFAQGIAYGLQPSKAELNQLDWITLKAQETNKITLANINTTLKGAVGKVIGYKIPADQGTLNISIRSLVTNDKQVFVPNVAVYDSQFNLSANYPASQFQFAEERGLQGAQFNTELNLTPVANQPFIYLLVYTTEQDLKGTTMMTHPAKLLAKAKGNQPPAISDIQVQHSTHGELSVKVETQNHSQFIGLSLPSFSQAKPQPMTKPTQVAPPKKVENSTEQYFNQAVLSALKQNDLNKALNLVNEAEALGLTKPRQIFLKHVAVQK